MTSGGAYLDPILAEEFDKLGIMLRQGYGMTEVGCRISVPDRGVSIESVGRVIDICDVRIENGEIQVKTPTIMLGYYKMPEETAKMFTEEPVVQDRRYRLCHRGQTALHHRQSQESDNPLERRKRLPRGDREEVQET